MSFTQEADSSDHRGLASGRPHIGLLRVEPGAAGAGSGLNPTSLPSPQATPFQSLKPCAMQIVLGGSRASASHTSMPRCNPDPGGRGPKVGQVRYPLEQGVALERNYAY